MIRAALLWLAFTLPCFAQDPGGETVVVGLSQNSVAITANFVGSEILIYGAVKREEAIPDGRLDVVITVQGPVSPQTVRRKERVWGIWVNRDHVEIDAAPSFYAVATTMPFPQVMSDTEDLRYKVSIPRAIRSVGAVLDDAPVFSEALIRLREAQGMYELREGTVELDERTLFNTRVQLPANLTEGNYFARIFLTRNGAVIDHLTTVIEVRKEGLERLLYTLALQQPILYGVLSLTIAIIAGWAAAAVFRYIRA